jgi:hypothetical protein
MRYPAAVALCLLMTACATKPDPVIRYVTQEVRVPVSVPCDPDIGPEPTYAASPEAIQAAPDIFRLTVLILAELQQRKARDEVKTAAIEACRSPRPG